MNRQKKSAGRDPPNKCVQNESPAATKSHKKVCFSFSQFPRFVYTLGSLHHVFYPAALSQLCLYIRPRTPAAVEMCCTM